MEVRITFRAEVFVKGKDLAECRQNFESMRLLDADAIKNNSADFCEIVSVEDAETYEEIDECKFEDAKHWNRETEEYAVLIVKNSEGKDYLEAYDTYDYTYQGDAEMPSNFSEMSDKELDKYLDDNVA